jgi:hypothetical protein
VNALCGLTAANILELVSRCPNLQRLEVHGEVHPFMHSDSWGWQWNLALARQQGRALAGKLGSELTDSWLGEVVRGCPQLTCLDLGEEDVNWEPTISQAAILEAISLRPELRIFLRK